MIFYASLFKQRKDLHLNWLIAIEKREVKRNTVRIAYFVFKKCMDSCSTILLIIVTETVSIQILQYCCFFSSTEHQISKHNQNGS